MIKIAVICSALFLMGVGIIWVCMPSLRKHIGVPFIANYLIILVADALLPNAFLIWPVIFISTVATIQSRTDAIFRLITFSVLVPGVSLSAKFGGVFFGSYSVIACISLAVQVHLAMNRKGQEKPVKGFTPEDGAVLMLFLIATVFSTRFDSITALLRTLSTWTFIFALPYRQIRNNIRTPRDIHFCIASLVAVSFPSILIGLFEVRAGFAVSDPLTHNAGLASSAMQRGGVLRASAMFGQPLIFAYYMVVVLIGMSTVKSWFKKGLWKYCFCFALFGLLLPQSRGAFLSLVPALMVLFLTLRRYGSAAAMLVLTSGGAFALLLMKGTSGYFGQMVQGDTSIGHYDYRGLLLERGVQEFWKHPLVGVSFNDTLVALRDITQGQGIVDMVNVYLWIALVSGFTGLGLFAMFVALSMRRLVARVKSRQITDLTHMRFSRAFLLAALTATIIYISSMSLIGSMPFFLAALLALSRSTANELIQIRRKSRGPNLIASSPSSGVPQAAAA